MRCAHELHTLAPLRTHESPSRVGARLHAREVGAGDRLGEELAPELVAGEDPRQMAAVEVVGRVSEHHLRAHAEGGAAGDAEVGELVAPPPPR